MAIERAFFDTNVLVYLLAADPTRALRAGEIMRSGGVISVQVLNEFVSVARRKHALDWDEIDEHLAGFRRGLQVEPITVDTQCHAVAIARRHRLDIYDATILAVAAQAGCEVLYTEDLQDGFQIAGGPVVRNPFRAS